MERTRTKRSGVAKGSAGFRETPRRGLLAVSTPSQDFYAADPLCVSKIARALIPKKVIPKLPALLRGPWLEQSLEEWEAKAGHYGHGCTLDGLTTAAKNCGLQVIHHRYSYTPLSFFWFELLATFPLFGLLASPVATLSMAIESRMPVRSGANLMVRFRNVSPAGNA